MMSNDVALTWGPHFENQYSKETSMEGEELEVVLLFVKSYRVLVYNIFRVC